MADLGIKKVASLEGQLREIIKFSTKWLYVIIIVNIELYLWENNFNRLKILLNITLLYYLYN